MSVRASSIALAVLCLSGLVPQAPGAEPARPAQQLDEVTVEGTRLYQLRQRIVAAEDRFYALYNQLNKDDDFDVYCTSEAPIGTRLKKRVCRAVFYAEAEADYAQSFVARLNGDAGGGTALSPSLIALTRDREYRATMAKVVKENPELFRLLRQRNALEQRYEEARRQRFGKR